MLQVLYIHACQRCRQTLALKDRWGWQQAASWATKAATAARWATKPSSGRLAELVL